MTKNGQKKGNKAKKLRKNAPAFGASARRASVQATLGRLDASAQQFARLLADPCAGPLVHPVYSGSDSGYLGRFETDFVVSSLGTSGGAGNFGALLFAPGCIGVSGNDTLSISGNTSVMFLGSSGTASDTDTKSWVCKGTPVAGTAPSVNPQPGAQFFAFGSEAVRCVAACLQIHYTGTELNRAGTVSLARVNAGSVLNSDFTSVSALRALSNYVDRTPDTHYEIIWTPSDGDQLFVDPSLITGQRQTERKNGVLLTYSGVPSTDLRVRLVCVYEWVPESGQGLISGMENRNRSSNTLDHVLNTLDKTGRWWLKNGHHVVNTGASLFKGAATLLGGM